MVYLNWKSDFGVHCVCLFLKWLAFVAETGRVASGTSHIALQHFFWIVRAKSIDRPVSEGTVDSHIEHEIILLEQVKSCQLK